MFILFFSGAAEFMIYGKDGVSAFQMNTAHAGVANHDASSKTGRGAKPKALSRISFWMRRIWSAPRHGRCSSTQR